MRNIMTIVRTEGIGGMYRGFSISLMAIPIFNTIYFPIYGEIKDLIRRHTSMKDGDVSFYAVSSGMAGFFCNILTNPIWIVRTRMQAEIFQSGMNAEYFERFDKKYGYGAFSLG